MLRKKRPSLILPPCSLFATCSLTILYIKWLGYPSTSALPQPLIMVPPHSDTVPPSPSTHAFPSSTSTLNYVHGGQTNYDNTRTDHRSRYNNRYNNLTIEGELIVPALQSTCIFTLETQVNINVHYPQPLESPELNVPGGQNVASPPEPPFNSEDTPSDSPFNNPSILTIQS